MRKRLWTPKRIVSIALIAGLYVALALAFAPISYGAIQIRVSEALTLLPVLMPDAILGVTVGCFLANLFSMSPWDMLFGTLATWIAAYMTLKLARIRWKGLPIASAIPPILVNAVVIGAEITYIFMPETASIQILLWNMLSVGIGQTISCGILGLLFVKALEKFKFVQNMQIKD